MAGRGFLSPTDYWTNCLMLFSWSSYISLLRFNTWFKEYYSSLQISVLPLIFSYVTGPSCVENKGDDEKTDNLARISNDQTEQCCGSNGICSHEVLRDGECDSDSKLLLNKFARKVRCLFFGSIHISFLLRFTDSFIGSTLISVRTGYGFE